MVFLVHIFIREPTWLAISSWGILVHFAGRIIKGDDGLLALSANDVLAGKFFPETEAGQRAGIVGQLLSERLYDPAYRTV